MLDGEKEVLCWADPELLSYRFQSRNDAAVAEVF
jgi:hypothetical protein